MSDCTAQFQNFLIDQTPVYSPEILKDVNPMSGTWLGKVMTRTWPNGNSNTQTYDRMHKVFPNPIREWLPKDYANCDGDPCSVPAEVICTGGYTRNTFYKEVQKHKSRVLCFDAIRDFTHAEEQWAFIQSEILRPAADVITSYYMKKRAASAAGKKWIANSAMTPFTFVWVVTGNNEVYIDTNAAPTAVFHMAPQMLQKRFTPLIRDGYFQQQVIEVPAKMAEFITDEETVQDLTRQLNDDGTTPLKLQWRYTDFAAASEFWKYGWSGSIGNYAMSTDPFQLRFNYVGTTLAGLYRYQVVLPYTNIAADVGNKISNNEDYDNAQYAFSYIHHRGAFCMYGATAQSIHPSMPFVIPDLGGQWRFETHDIGCENYEHNKGLFFARFEYAWKNEHEEWEELFFHRREPPCIPEIGYCNEDPGYPTQTYGCSDELCDGGCWDYTAGDDVAANTVTVGGFPIVHAATNEANLADLVDALNADPVLSLLGTWAAGTTLCDGEAGESLVLQNPTTSETVEVTLA